MSDATSPERARMAGIHYGLIRASMKHPSYPDFPEWCVKLEEYGVDPDDDAQLKAFTRGFVDQWNGIWGEPEARDEDTQLNRISIVEGGMPNRRAAGDD